MTDSHNFFVHERAICESQTVGAGSRIWAFAHVLPNANIGDDCNICDHVFVENDVVIGSRVTLKCGVQVWDGITIEDDVFVGPNVTFTNDIFPRSKVYPTEFARTIIRKGASLGANSTILPGITIGSSAMVGAGSVVTKSVPPNAIVVGNPAKIIGYVDAKATNATIVESPSRVGASEVYPCGVTLHRMLEAVDIRGSLSVGEFERDIPFSVKRYFLVSNVPTAETRGEHAHRECHQFLIAVKGTVHVVADNGTNRQEFVLDSHTLGLLLPAMTWGIQYKYSSDAVLLVFASEHYEASDYIRDYDQFLLEKKDVGQL
ncbi:MULTISPECIES: WxcM-like domain-containing protein [Pseudomonas]|jgi:UDP-2-acetamido-3-amino-2,3-dideoxy-glucuronate N-acetyltransferase|uniref:Isomerase n=2 Tax=Pseudomonas TaxID=286 RepID=V8R456_9PSED|nr:WxcM-like domain-containing protein [Pseudomonas moraviensis]ETF06443.1 isomerase [Pseudomonas moraviensis R28-S]